MLFGWPCLQLTFKGDQTEKYSGQLLIANIIEKFAINRKIVLQVFNTLVRAHQQDHKEVVRKALDILIPAIPKRMDDGYLQLHTMIKKVVIEESHNTAQITHCLYDQRALAHAELLFRLETLSFVTTKCSTMSDTHSRKSFSAHCSVSSRDSTASRRSALWWTSARCSSSGSRSDRRSSRRLR